ncbi:50S ribosomal protein L21 [Candidatus Westeberhardia cardiocondylae]|uniref:Large ribosomal subunit protein bL21 n=1 Tax=Candidatus Westeberhardia cardiocondylae TaxID=1594731 RepID=A0A0H5BWT6_9ENTR|nr:50S ribosomal protein L21 [Candidatus Westeberhardia cardiocondylae]MCR3756497.1 50S ribosomal subunit protein L21 [Candidatus Westeberhardia cardiocondylae]CEN32143.1 50S ribosomal protein L21 [Candidatus Westeberhardia cardiocondylae]
MHAIFQYGSKQYKVKENQVIYIEKLNLEINEILIFDKIIMLIYNRNVRVGFPFINNSKIIAKVLKHGRFDKLVIVKFHRRKHYKKIQGHRQWYTKIKINNIIENG